MSSAMNVGGPTPDEIELLHRRSGLDISAPFVIRGVSHGQLSIARHYGGCTYQGQPYTYASASDELIRVDVLEWLTKHRRALNAWQKAALKAAEQPPETGALF